MLVSVWAFFFDCLFDVNDLSVCLLPLLRVKAGLLVVSKHQVLYYLATKIVRQSVLTSYQYTA
jgi:hypothetical protein